MIEKLVERRKVEFKDGEIYATEKLDEIWVPVETELYGIDENNITLCNLGTKRLVELQYKTMRNRK